MKNLLNLFKKTKIKMILILTILLFAYTTVCAISYAQNISTDIANSVFRLHVIANSDSTEDQNLKYLVRDNILNYIQEISNGITSKSEIIEIIKSHSSEIHEIATKTIEENGYNYPVSISIGNFAFPTKKYGDITLPAGLYDAVRVEIGSAKGQNWWCVMFPPLCFVDTTSGIVPENSKKLIQDNLSQEEYNLISKDTSSVKVKFKIVELLQNFTISGIFM